MILLKKELRIWTIIASIFLALGCLFHLIQVRIIPYQIVDFWENNFN